VKLVTTVVSHAKEACLSVGRASTMPFSKGLKSCVEIKITYFWNNDFRNEAA